jgi:transcriptional regulator with XRE-family HTH domain
MDIHQQIKRLRTERNWTQAQLAEKLGIRQKQISAYERSVTKPSTEILIRLADVLDVSLDYLAFEAEGQSARVAVKDRELLRCFEAIDAYTEEERRVAKDVLNLVIMKHKFQELAHA